LFFFHFVFVFYFLENYSLVKFGNIYFVTINTQEKEFSPLTYILFIFFLKTNKPPPTVFLKPSPSK